MSTAFADAWQSAAARMNSLGPPIRCRSGINTSAARAARPPAARLVTYGDVDRAALRVEADLTLPGEEAPEAPAEEEEAAEAAEGEAPSEEAPAEGEGGE